MKSHTVAGLALSLLLAATAYAQTAAPTDPIADRVRADITFLADDALEGRDTGSRGYDLAALYVASRYQSLGLTPAGNAEGTSWLQPVRFGSSRIVGGSVGWTGADGAMRTWAHGGAVGLFAAADAGAASQSAEVVFVGYGLDAPGLGYDDYRDLDVRGKLVLAFVGAPEGGDSAVAASLADEKLKMAEARGAVGMIYLPTPEMANEFPWAMVIRYLTAPRMTWLEADGRPHGATSRGFSQSVINAEAAEAMFAGADQSYADVMAAAAIPGAHPVGFALKGSATVTSETEATVVETANVAAMLPGSDPALRDQLVVVMAHLDHVGMLDDAGAADRINNGALDNASGVATMLEVARALSEGDQAPRRSVMFLAVTGEEKGLLGSAAYAGNPSTPLDRIAGVVNLDMPILLYDFTDVVAFGSEHSTLGPIVAEAAASQGLTLSPDPMPEEGLFTRSDHYSFVERGVPAVFLATGHANGGAAAWKTFLDGNYHHPGDDVTQPIDWAAAAKFARVNTAIARAIADADQRPLWYEGSVFGDRFAPTAAKAPAP